MIFFPRSKLLCGLLLLGFGARVLGAVSPVHSDWGPFHARWTDVNQNERQKSLGPVYERIETPEGWHFGAVRPLLASWDHAGDEVHRREILWPVARQSFRGEEHNWRFLLAFGLNRDVADPESRYRVWVLPFYFQGRDKHGETYLAVFPFGGSIHEFLLWDEVSFTLFPLYVRSRAKDIEAESWIWPVFSKTDGPGIRRRRVFPFYGYSEREGFGRKEFILWPFWTSVEYTHPKMEGSGWILFPVTGHLKTPDQESWWILPPFFRYHVGEEKNRIFGPWPFVQISEGATDKFYLWPLYGRKTIGDTRRDFFLWPIGSHETHRGSYTHKTRTFVVPVYQSFQESDPATGEILRDYTKVWPLFSHSYHHEGPARRTVFPDLNPFREGPIERNWAPFWQLYRREQVGEAVDTEVLWGIYRSIKREEFQYRSLFPLLNVERGEDHRSVNLLKGLLGWHREPGNNQLRLLYFFRFGGRSPDEL